MLANHRENMAKQVAGGHPSLPSLGVAFAPRPIDKDIELVSRKAVLALLRNAMKLR
jgi:hypothetical protein